jgi:hypothetical protein
LCGLALLAWKNWWWPGILILLALSGVIEALIMQKAPNSYVEAADDDNRDDAPAPPPAPPTPLKPASPIQADQHPELLPSNCPKCGAPVDSRDVKWTGPRSADCSYCGAKLPMEKAA